MLVRVFPVNLCVVQARITCVPHTSHASTRLSPDCSDCVHGAPEKPTSYVDNSFCDCRSGLDVAPDYAPCWNSCLDCFGDDGEIVYMPSDLAEACLGEEVCFIRADPTTLQWYSCDGTMSDSSCTASSAGVQSIPDMSKSKGIDCQSQSRLDRNTELTAQTCTNPIPQESRFAHDGMRR